MLQSFPYRFQVAQFIFATKRHVCGNQRSLNRINDPAHGFDRLSARNRNKKSELMAS